MQQNTAINPIRCTYSIKPETAEKQTLAQAFSATIQKIVVAPFTKKISRKYHKFQNNDLLIN